MSRSCASCGADNPARARFCVACGAELLLSCPRCSAVIPAGARFCPTCGLELGEGPAAVERKVATVVFVDLVDPTALAEGLDPERVRAILQEYFSTAATTVEAWGGTVEK